MGKRLVDDNNHNFKLNTNQWDNFDWKLFVYNMKHSKAAQKNLAIYLEELLRGEFSSYSESIYKIFKCYMLNIVDNENYKQIGTCEAEFVNMLAYYYLYCIENNYDNDLSNIQNNIEIQFPTNRGENFTTIINNYGFQEYVSKYYIPRLKRQNSNIHRTLDKSNIQDWTQAIEIIKKIDLANIIKQVIIGVNIGELLFEMEQSNNSDKIVKPIFLNNGHCQCWFRSSFQLVYSMVECSSEELKKLLTSQKEYVLIQFLKYLKNKSSSHFTNNQNRISAIQNNKAMGLDFNKELLNFEESLPNDIKNAWSNLQSVIEGKKIIKYLNDKGIQSNITIALPILAKLFPEIEFLLPAGELNDVMNILDNNKANFEIAEIHDATVVVEVLCADYSIFYRDDIDSELFVKLPKDAYSTPYYFITEGTGNPKMSLADQINTSQYRIGFDNNGSFVVCTLKGMQLSHTFNSGVLQTGNCGHFWSHVALDNISSSWCFADTTGFYSNPYYACGMNAAYADQFYNDPSCTKRIHACVYRKITPEEISNYMK